MGRTETWESSNCVKLHQVVGQESDIYTILFSNLLPEGIMGDIMSKTRNQQYRNEEKRISYALMASYVVLTAQYFILVSLNLMNTATGSTVQLISKLVVGIVFLGALPVVLKRTLARFLTIYWGSAFIFVMHYIVFPQNQEMMQSLFFDIFFISMPALIYSMAIDDFDIFREIMNRAANIVMIFGTLTAFYAITGRASVGSYSMPLSYYMLLPALVYLERVIDKLSLKNLLLFAVSLGVILSLGARGPVLCLGVFFLLKMSKPSAGWTKRRVLGYAGLLGVFVACLVFFDEMILLLDDFLRNLGVKSRTLSLFIRGDIYLSGRDQLYGRIVPEIIDSPFIGIGLAGDYRILGGYVHNFFIEILGNFGIVVGVAFIAVVLLWTLRLLFKGDQQIYGLISMWLSLGFVHLMVSSSYLADLQFWIFFGLVVNLSLGTGKRAKQRQVGLTNS